jgi:hypothetical protein
MLQALIKAKAEVLNILNIVRVNQRGGEQFYQTMPATPAFPSLAEQTIKSYTSGDDVTKSTTKSDDQECFSCGGPHPWSKHQDGKWVIICPNASKPGVQEHTKLEIVQFQVCKKRHAKEYWTKRNANTINWEDLPASI